MSHPPGRLLAGQIGKPHGLQGEVYVMPISDDPERFAAGSRLEHADGRVLEVESSRWHRNRLLVRFAGIADRTAAERLRGALYVDPERLRALGADEYWEHEIVGCAVFDADGVAVGQVTDVVARAGQDLLAVATPGGERLVPLVREIVVRVDIGERRVVVDPPAGLLS